MRYWLLTFKPEGGVAGFGRGEAHELQSRASIGNLPISNAEEAIDVRFDPDENEYLFNIATSACKLGYDLLWRENHLRYSMTIRFDVKNIPHNIQGQSSCLIFALVAICQGWRRNIAHKAIAATGALGSDGEILAVVGIVAKLHAAINTLPSGGIAFYPEKNHFEINAEIISAAQVRKVQLVPVARLEQAVAYLGIPLTITWRNASPYRGLEIFEYEHHSIYFGRKAETDSACKKLIERHQADQPGLLVLGPSGAGKSSFVKAGILPALIEMHAEANIDWVVWRPQYVSIRNEAGLYNSIMQNWEILPAFSRFRSEPQSGELSEILTWLVKDQIDGRRFIWTIDQLEELFTLSFTEEIIAIFSNFILNLQRMGVWIIATLRSDFYSEYQKHEYLVETFKEGGIFDLTALKREALRQVIEGPAKAGGFYFEINKHGISLVDQLLSDAGATENVLPLLEFTLTELYWQRNEGKRLLTFSAYKDIGGIKGSIAKAAERAINEHDQELNHHLPVLLRALVRVEEEKGSRDTAKILNLELANFNDATHKLIDKLVAQRLLIMSGGESGKQLRVAHEALFSHWKMAQDILDQSREYMLVRDRLIRDATLWAQSGYHKSRLLATGMPLADGQKLLTSYSEELEEEPDLIKYIQASIGAEQRRTEKEAQETQALTSTHRKIRQQKWKEWALLATILGLLVTLMDLGWNVWEGKRRIYRDEPKAVMKKGDVIIEKLQKNKEIRIELDINLKNISIISRKLENTELHSSEKSLLLQQLRETLTKQEAIKAQLDQQLAEIEAIARSSLPPRAP